MPGQRVLAPCVLFLLVWCPGFAGCGGSGGGNPPAEDPPDPPAPVFTGTYHYVLLRADEHETEPLRNYAASIFGKLGPGTDGNLTLVTGENKNGVTPGSSQVGGIPYQVGAGPSVSWSQPINGTSLPVTGGLSPDGRYGVVASIADGEIPAIGVLVRRGEGAHSNASFEGDYHLSTWQYNHDAGENHGRSGGGGLAVGVPIEPEWDYPCYRNVDGSTEAHGESGTRAVGADSTLIFQKLPAVPGSDMFGGIAAGGDVAVLGGATTSTQWPGLYVVVKETAQATSSTFSGTYDCVVFWHQSAGYSCGLGSVEADGVDSWTGTFTFNQEGTVVPNVSRTASIGVVTTTGRLSMTLPTGDVVEGGITESGDFAMAGGGMNDGDHPQIWVFVRK